MSELRWAGGIVHAIHTRCGGEVIATWGGSFRCIRCGYRFSLEPKSDSAPSGAMAKVGRCVAELIDALDDAASGLESAANGEGVNFFAYAEEARAAIAKANAFYPQCLCLGGQE